MMVHSHPTHEYTTFECWFYKLTFSYMEKLTHCLRDCKLSIPVSGEVKVDARLIKRSCS